MCICVRLEHSTRFRGKSTYDVYHRYEQTGEQNDQDWKPLSTTDGPDAKGREY